MLAATLTAVMLLAGGCRDQTSAPIVTSRPMASADRDAIYSELRQAPIRDRRAYLFAVRNYDTPESLERLAAAVLVGSPSWRAALRNIATLRENRWRVRPHTDAVETIAVESVRLGPGPPYTDATVVTCEVGTSVVYEPAAGPHGSETIVNDDIVARRDRSTYVVDDGVWKLTSGTNLGEWKGATKCPPA